MRPHLRQIADDVFVTAQLEPDDMRDLAAAGFTVLVNHRPDGEEPGQPTAAELKDSATREGLSCTHAPVQGLPDEAAVSATRAALDAVQSGDKVLMFCRSGMRSACTWAMAERQNGVDPDVLRDAAMNAGYDLGRVPL